MTTKAISRRMFPHSNPNSRKKGMDGGRPKTDSGKKGLDAGKKGLDGGKKGLDKGKGGNG